MRVVSKCDQSKVDRKGRPMKDLADWIIVGLFAAGMIYLALFTM